MFLAIMVLPRPLEPSRTRLRPSRMNSRVSARSRRSRSTFLGQFQSKSARGLKRPMRARCSRPCKLRRVFSICSSRAISSRICAGDQRPLVARARKSSSDAPTAERPTLVSRLARSVAFVVIVIVAREFIVGLRGMGFDVEVLEIGTAGEIDGKGRSALGLTSALAEDVDDGADTRGLPGLSLFHGQAQLLCSIVVEQEEESFRGERHRLAALESRLQERLRTGHRSDQPRTGTRSPRSPLLREKRLDVGGVLDAPVTVVAAAVTCDLDGAIEHAHGGLGS